MKLTYQLTCDHYLKHQLFIASQSHSVQQKRKRSRVLVSLVYIALGLLLLALDLQNFLGWTFVALAVGWYFWYPIYSKKRYYKHYEKYIQEHYQNRVNVPIDLEIEKEYILAKDKTAESKVNIEEVESLVSIPNIYLVKLKSGTSFIIPKDQVNDQKMLEEVFVNLGIRLWEDPEWEWK